MSDLQDTVHILPLGHEYGRAVAPFRERVVDRVYILSISDQGSYPEEMIRRQKYFTEKVRDFLEKKSIKVYFREVNLFDLMEVMKHVSSVIEEEKGNHISVNMSACGRLTSIGATLAAMSKGVSVYYVKAENYALDYDTFMEHGLSVSTSNIPVRFKNFQFVLPDDVSRQILVKLYTENKAMKIKEIQTFLYEMKVPGFDIHPDEIGKSLKYSEKRLESSKQFMKLEKRYLEKLKNSGYIEREKVGRENRITITESGKYIACISIKPGLLPNE